MGARGAWEAWGLGGLGAQGPSARWSGASVDRSLRAPAHESHAPGNKSLPYRSVNEGVAHLCGHDGHIAALCATAIALQRRADRIPSNMTVRLLFQPAEEGPGGALPMIKEGCLDGVDEVYGWHNWPAWPMGRLVVAPGTVMAHVMDMQITIRGRGGHGSQPHVCADPIVCGAAVVSALQTVVSRCLPSWSNAVVSVCTFHSGERFNVIPDTAELGGTIRDVDEQVAKTIRRRLPELVNCVCAAYGCTAEVKLESLYPAVVNHAENVKIVERCSATLKDPLSLTVSQEGIPLMGAEDFSFYLRERPGCFFFLGTQELLHRSLAAYEGGEDQPRSNCICHGTTYDFNDNVLPRALMMFVRIVEDRFGLSLYTQEELLKPAFQLVAEEPAAKRAKTA